MKTKRLLKEKQPDYIFYKFRREMTNDKTICQFHFIFKSEFNRHNEFLYTTGENAEAEFSSCKFRELPKLEAEDFTTEEEFFEIAKYYKYNKRFNFSENINLLLNDQLETVNYRTVARSLKM